MNIGMNHMFILFVFSILALYFDLKYKIIPNRLNIIFLTVGIISHINFNFEIFLHLFSNLVLMFIVGIFLNVIKVLAMGDVKYYLVTTVIIGFQNSISIICFTIMLGVPLGVIYVIFHHGLMNTIRKLRLNLLHLLISPLNMNQLTKFPLMVASFPAALIWILIEMNGVEQRAPFNVLFSEILNYATF